MKWPRWLYWLHAPQTVERGEECATKFLAERPTQEKINRAYLSSRGCLDRNDFDLGWERVLEPHVSQHIIDFENRDLGW